MTDDINFDTTLIAANPGFSVIRAWHDKKTGNFKYDTEPVIAWRVYNDKSIDGHHLPVTPLWTQIDLYEPRYGLVFPDGHVGNDHCEYFDTVAKFKEWYEANISKLPRPPND
jgi:hypothetical protein